MPSPTEKFYWDFTPSVLDTNVLPQYKTNAPLIQYTISQVALHLAQKMAIFGRDGDRLMCGDTL